MGIFNRKKKEEEFNYDEMMVAAKLEYLNSKTNSNNSNSNYSYYENLMHLVESNTFSYVYKIQTYSCSLNTLNQILNISTQLLPPSNVLYEKTTEETNCMGVYDKNNKLLLAFEIDLDKLILYRYLIYKTNLPRKASVLYKKINMQPIKNVHINKDLLTNYSVVDVLKAIININWYIFYDDITIYTNITSDYIYTAINMYISNKNK